MTIRSRSCSRSRPSTPGRSGAATTAVLVTSMALALVLAGCRKPQPPDPELPPEPQAGTAATTSPSTAAAAGNAATGDGGGDASRTGGLREAGRDGEDGYQTPLERVRDVETKVGDAADRTRARIDPP